MLCGGDHIHALPIATAMARALKSGLKEGLEQLRCKHFASKTEEPHARNARFPARGDAAASWVSLAKGCCWLARRCLNLTWAGCADPSVSTQGLCDNLIHVVVTIGRESADKLDIMCSVRQLSITEI